MIEFLLGVLVGQALKSKDCSHHHDWKRGCDQMINNGTGDESYHCWNMRHHGHCPCW